MRNLMIGLLLAGCSGLGFAANQAMAETAVTVSNTHLCCPACVRAVDKALSDVAGVQYKANAKEGTIAIKAENDAAAQKAIDALAKAGFHGKLDNKAVKFSPVKPPSGTVKRLEVTGIHNCCGACNKAIKAALKEVDGVQADTAQAKESSFVVEGEFSAAEVVEALLNAGFHVQVK